MKFSNSILYSMMAVAGTLFAGCSDDPKMPANPDTPVAVAEATDDIIYEVNPRFYGSSDCLNAINADLDNISATGANILWIMPVNEPGVLNSIGSPYSVRDFKAVNPAYGTVADLKKLVDNAHSKGMTVILDWIANHTAWDCAWTTDHKDWYTQDANGNIISPEGSGWTDVADLNYDNAEMRAAMIDAMVYWIEAAGIDGYRCDHVDGVPVDFWSEAISALRAKKSDFFMLAESSDAKYFEAGFDMNYGWPFGSALSNLFNGKINATKFFDESTKEISALPAGKRVMRYALNHDTAAENSLNSIYGSSDALMAAYALAMFVDGTPMIYSAQAIDYTGTLGFFDYTARTFDAAKIQQLKALGQAYKATRDVRSGELWKYSAGNAVMFVRALGDSRMLVIVNPTGNDLTVKTPIELASSSMTDALTGQPVVLPVAVNLPAYQYMVYYK